MADGVEIVTWDEKYSTGIELIDTQHKQLLQLTNDLYYACVTGDKMLQSVFKDTMSRMVEYVHFHFGVEQELLLRVKYPGYKDHKIQHDNMIRNILVAAKNYSDGKHFVPNHFVRTLKDWIFSHIAVSDRHYADYVAEQKKKGLLNTKQINGQST